MKVYVRPEEPSDAPAVRRVNEQAFEGTLEADIVESLRGAEGVISLVAVRNDSVVGHIMFTPVTLASAPADLKVAGLGPMAVRPDLQRLGIGRQLVRDGLHHCRARGFKAVVVVGHPEYYPRFGFAPAHNWDLLYEHPLPREAFMAMELEPGVLVGQHGVVRYRPEFSAGA